MICRADVCGQRSFPSAQAGQGGGAGGVGAPSRNKPGKKAPPGKGGASYSAPRNRHLEMQVGIEVVEYVVQVGGLDTGLDVNIPA
jgi:hypothetical protein